MRLETHPITARSFEKDYFIDGDAFERAYKLSISGFSECTLDFSESKLMPKYYDFMICGYYLYFTSHCIVEAMHVHVSDRHLRSEMSNNGFYRGE